MLYFVRSAELRVFILERVVTMWAWCHDLLHVMAGKRLDIRLRGLLEKELIADSTRGIARTTLLWAEHREIHPSFLEQLSRRTRHLLRARIERRGAADPEQILEGGIRFDRRHAEAFRPGQAIGVWATVGVGLVGRPRRADGRIESRLRVS